MQIQRTSLTTISPRTLEELLKRQSGTFYNASRELRKPLGIYNVTLANIWESFKDVLDELDQVLDQQAFRQGPSQQWDKTLMRRQEYLISQLMRYFDDCFSLLSCFYPITQPTPEEDKKDLMKQPSIRAAMVAARPYRYHIGNMMNHIKHQQGMLRGVVSFNDNVAIPGYFVEHMNQSEVLEPHPMVHPLYKGHNTSFSFFRDLRFNFWIVYVVAEYVADAITQISPLTQYDMVKADSDNEVAQIANRIAMLPKWVFQDESVQSFPHIKIDTRDGITHLTLEYPSQRIILPAFSGPSQVVVVWTGDGTTRSFGLPYR
jgi:hypothetical protein